MRKHKKKINEMIIRAQIIYNEQYAEEFGEEKEDVGNKRTSKKS